MVLEAGPANINEPLISLSILIYPLAIAQLEHLRWHRNREDGQDFALLVRSSFLTIMRS